MTMGKVKWGGFLLESIKQIALWKEEKKWHLHKRFYYVCINGIKIEILQERIISAVRPRTFKQKF